MRHGRARVRRPRHAWRTPPRSTRAAPCDCDSPTTTTSSAPSPGQFGAPAALAASAMMFTLDGVPLLYNGMEVGDTTESAAPALFERTPIHGRWPSAARTSRLTTARSPRCAARTPRCTTGAVRWLRNADEARIVSFERAGRGEALVVVANLSSQAFHRPRRPPAAGAYRTSRRSRERWTTRTTLPSGVLLLPGNSGFSAGPALEYVCIRLPTAGRRNILGNRGSKASISDRARSQPRPGGNGCARADNQ